MRANFSNYQLQTFSFSHALFRPFLFLSITIHSCLRKLRKKKIPDKKSGGWKTIFFLLEHLNDISWARLDSKAFHKTWSCDFTWIWRIFKLHICRRRSFFICFSTLLFLLVYYHRHAHFKWVFFLLVNNCLRKFLKIDEAREKTNGNVSDLVNLKGDWKLKLKVIVMRFFNFLQGFFSLKMFFSGNRLRSRKISAKTKFRKSSSNIQSHFFLFLILFWHHIIS